MTTTSKQPILTSACDSHIHVFDSRFSAPDGSPIASSSVSEYRGIQKRMGTARTVIVTPRPYVTDNTCTLDAISQLGISAARGIAVVHPSVTDTELKKLDDGGIRGIRFSVGSPTERVTTVDMIEPLAKRVANLGWHVQLHIFADQIMEHSNMIERLELPIVFDHMGRLPPPDGTKHPAFQVIRRLIDRGQTWVKLSSSLLRDHTGHRLPTTEELADTARAFIAAAPERLVWGSDWPHRGDQGKPDDVERFDALAQWVNDEPTRRRILVDNPEVLYGFPKAS